MSKIDGVAVDACVIQYMVPELARGDGATLDLVHTILRNFGIVLDLAGKIEEEWCRRSSELLDDWITDQFKLGALRYVQAHLDRAIITKLHSQFGLPRNGSRDIEYIRCANVTKTRYVLTEDMHLFDPRVCAGTAKAKARAKDSREGALCRFLKKKLDIVVGARTHCKADLGLP